jgi:hypothetical protein
MADNTIRIKIEIKQPDLRRRLYEIIRSTQGMQFQKPQDTRGADLLIFELGDDTENEFQHIRSLLNSDAVAEVFLISENSDPEVLLQAIKTGAKEFFLLPLKEEEVQQALEKFKKKRKRANRSKDAPEIGQIITVIGSKGGDRNNYDRRKSGSHPGSEKECSIRGPDRHEYVVWRNTALSGTQAKLSLGRNNQEYFPARFHLFNEHPFQTLFRSSCPPVPWQFEWFRIRGPGDDGPSYRFHARAF